MRALIMRSLLCVCPSEPQTGVPNAQRSSPPVRHHRTLRWKFLNALDIQLIPLKSLGILAIVHPFSLALIPSLAHSLIIVVNNRLIGSFISPGLRIW